MHRINGMGTFLALTIASVLLATGCAQKSPLEQMVENRARYSAEMNGFFVDEIPIEPVAAPADDVEADGEGAEAEGDGEELLETPVEVRQQVTLDILLRHDSFEKLPGITVDLTMVDSEMNEKERWLVWIDTSAVERANPTQFEHVIEDADYEEGDAFGVEVRHPVPEADRADYREFSDLGG